MNDDSSLAKEIRVLGDVTDLTMEMFAHDELPLRNGDDDGNAATLSCYNDNGGENIPLP